MSVFRSDPVALACDDRTRTEHHGGSISSGANHDHRLVADRRPCPLRGTGACRSTCRSAPRPLSPRAGLAGRRRRRPPSARHRARDRRRAGNAGPTIDELAPEPIGAATYRLRTGGSGERSLIVCCTVGFDEPAVHPLRQSMPEALLVRCADTSDPALTLLLSLMAEETAAQRMGSATVMARLADAVITHVVRAWVEGNSATMKACAGRARTELSGWLAAIRDPQIAKTLAVMHRRPGHAWSGPSAGLDRTHVLVRRTLQGARRHVACTVPCAVAHARGRQVAAKRRLTVAKVAEQLGYESEASFSRAFKRRLGVAPGTLRRRLR